jgi:hypothetical protein
MAELMERDERVGREEAEDPGENGRKEWFQVLPCFAGTFVTSAGVANVRIENFG